MDKQLYHVSLCHYDETDMPVDDYVFFVRCDHEPTKDEIMKDYRVIDLMHENNNDGISLIMSVDDKKLEEYDNPEVLYL